MTTSIFKPLNHLRYFCDVLLGATYGCIIGNEIGAEFANCGLGSTITTTTTTKEGCETTIHRKTIVNASKTHEFVGSMFSGVLGGSIGYALSPYSFAWFLKYPIAWTGLNFIAVLGLVPVMAWATPRSYWRWNGISNTQIRLLTRNIVSNSSSDNATAIEATVDED